MALSGASDGRFRKHMARLPSGKIAAGTPAAALCLRYPMGTVASSENFMTAAVEPGRLSRNCLGW